MAATTQKPVAMLDADYLAKLAHELKTPLTAIAAAAEIMRDEQLGEMKNARYLSYAADIHESATHAIDVIASLLADRSKPAVTVSRLIALDLNAIVERTVSSVQALAESCGLKLSFDTDGSRPHVVANPTALRQILLNLLTNAIKFTPRGGEVSVATGHIDDGRVFLAVRDTGCGMTGSGTATGSISARGSATGLGPQQRHRVAACRDARARYGRGNRNRQRASGRHRRDDPFCGFSRAVSNDAGRRLANPM